MATVQFALDHVCEAGGHASISTSLNAGAATLYEIHREQMDTPITDDERALYVLLTLKLFRLGKTNNQFRTGLQNGFTVTI